MKTHLLFLTACIAWFSASAQVKPELKRINLYYNTAQATYTVPLKLNAGNNSFKIGPLPLSVVQSSIVFGATDNPFVQSAHFEIPEPISKNEAKAIYDTIQAISLRIIFLRKDIAMLQSESALLNENFKLGDVQNHVDGQEMGKLLEYQLKQRERIDSSIAVLQSRIAQNEERVRAEESKREQRMLSNRTIQYLNVQVLSDKSGTVNLPFTVFLRNAEWSPTYSLRKLASTSQLLLELKATIKQTTGENWNQVALTLFNSTADQVVELPELTTPNFIYSGQKLDFQSPQVPIREFAIGTPVDVKSSATGMILIADSTFLEGNVQSQLFPLVDQQAYLTARISNWASYQWITSDVRLFNEDEFAGRTNVNLNTISDTLQLSLGKDQRLVCKRETYPTEKKTGVFAKDKLTYSSKITVKNNHKQAVTVVVWDRIPVSKVFSLELLEGSGAQYDPETGMLKWEFTLKGGELKELPVKYLLQVPQGMKIEVGEKI